MSVGRRPAPSQPDEPEQLACTRAFREGRIRTARPQEETDCALPLRRRIAYGLLTVYKYGPSQLFQLAGARCQHLPTCSEYGAECVARHGWWPGFWMSLARLLRCRPGGTSGYDPPPDTCPAAPVWAPWRYGDWRGPRHGQEA